MEEDTKPIPKEEEIKLKHAEFAEKHKETFNDVFTAPEFDAEKPLIAIRKLSEAGSECFFSITFQ